MKKRWYFLLAALSAVGAVLATNSKSHAFDHQDNERVIKQPAADITDVYAFMRPEPDGANGYNPSTHLVMVMNFDPTSVAGGPLAPNIDYIFRVRGANPDLSLNALPNFKVLCSFTKSSPQQLLCNANGVAFTTSAIGDTNAQPANAPMRAFAGLRSDPAFADANAFRDTVKTGQNKFVNPGTNAFQGKNVMSIVVEIDVGVVALQDTNAAKPIFAVGAETVVR